jgi:hypothetical protein
MAKKKPDLKSQADQTPHRLAIYIPADIHAEEIERIQIRWERVPRMPLP